MSQFASNPIEFRAVDQRENHDQSILNNDFGNMLLN